MTDTSRRGFLKGLAAMAAGVAALAATRSLPELPQTAEPAPTPAPGPRLGYHQGEVDISDYVTKPQVDQYAFERFRGPHMGEELVRDQLECMGYHSETWDDAESLNNVDLTPTITERLKGALHG
jgi:hypothetical protein